MSIVQLETSLKNLLYSFEKRIQERFRKLEHQILTEMREELTNEFSVFITGLKKVEFDLLDRKELVERIVTESRAKTVQEITEFLGSFLEELDSKKSM